MAILKTLRIEPGEPVDRLIDLGDGFIAGRRRADALYWLPSMNDSLELVAARGRILRVRARSYGSRSTRQTISSPSGSMSAGDWTRTDRDNGKTFQSSVDAR